MKKIYGLMIIILSACGGGSENPSSANSAVTINGTSSTITASTATSTFGNEVSINLTAGSNAIAIYLSDKSAGTYAVQKGKLSGRTEGLQNAFVSVINGQITYAGTSGTVTISIDSQGRISGTFNFTASGGGNTLTISSGSFSRLTIGKISAGQCFFNFNGVAYSSSQGISYCIPNYTINGMTASVAFGSGNNTATNTWLVYAGLSNGNPIIEFIPNSSTAQTSIYINSDPKNPGNGFNGSVTHIGSTYTFSGTVYSYDLSTSVVTAALISGVISCK